MRLSFKDMLFGSTTFTPASTCFMPGEGEGDGGGGSGGSETPAAGAGEQKDTSVLSDASQDGGTGSKSDDKSSDDNASKDGKPPANETPEQKTAREAAEKKAKDDKTAASLKDYGEKVKLPDGLAKDHPIAQEFFKDAAERGLSSEDAQAMVTRMGPELVKAINQPYDAWAETQKTWIESLPKDKEFGGANYKENLGLAALAMDTIFQTIDDKGNVISGRDTPEGKAYREMLAFTGVGNNPEQVRLLYRIGKMMKEGTIVMGKPKVDNVPLANKMYPTMA